MRSRSKSPQGRPTRSLGSNSNLTAHYERELEYSLIKSLVEAYSQQFMPTNNNNVPLRADKWAPDNYRDSLCTANSSDTISMTRPKSGSQVPVKESMANGTTDEKPDRVLLRHSMKNHGDNKHGDFKYSHYFRKTPSFTAGSLDAKRPASQSSQRGDRMKYGRPMTPIRTTFQRNSSDYSEEKVLPVWTPDLEKSIVFHHRYPSTSFMASLHKEEESREPPLRTTTPISAYNRARHNYTDNRGRPSTADNGGFPQFRIKSPKLIRTVTNTSNAIPINRTLCRPQTVHGHNLRSNSGSSNNTKPSSAVVTENHCSETMHPLEKYFNGRKSNDINVPATELTQSKYRPNVLSLNVFLPRDEGLVDFHDNNSNIITFESKKRINNRGIGVDEPLNNQKMVSKTHNHNPTIENNGLEECDNLSSTSFSNSSAANYNPRTNTPINDLEVAGNDIESNNIALNRTLNQASVDPQSNENTPSPTSPHYDCDRTARTNIDAKKKAEVNFKYSLDKPNHLHETDGENPESGSLSGLGSKPSRPGMTPYGRHGNCKKDIHCELFGPALCSHCRLDQERISIGTNTMISIAPCDEIFITSKVNSDNFTGKGTPTEIISSNSRMSFQHPGSY